VRGWAAPGRGLRGSPGAASSPSRAFLQAAVQRAERLEALLEQQRKQLLAPQ